MLANLVGEDLVPSSPDRLSDQLLIVADAVGVGRVQEVDPRSSALRIVACVTLRRFVVRKTRSFPCSESILETGPPCETESDFA